MMAESLTTICRWIGAFVPMMVAMLIAALVCPGCASRHVEPDIRRLQIQEFLEIQWLSESEISVDQILIDIRKADHPRSVRGLLDRRDDDTACVLVVPTEHVRFHQIRETVQFMINRVSDDIWLTVQDSDLPPVPLPMPVAAGLDPAFILAGRLYSYPTDRFVTVRWSDLSIDSLSSRPMILLMDPQVRVSGYLEVARTLFSRGMHWYVVLGKENAVNLPQR